MRSSVSMVMRLPSRSRCTSLPSLTTRRPNVVSAMSAWRQKSDIWLRIWSFFIGRGFGKFRWAARMAGPSYHHLPNGGNPAAPSAGMDRRPPLNPNSAGGNKAVSATATANHGDLMRRAILILTLLAAALWSAPSLAQSRAQLGPLCTTDTTPADQQINACNKIIALKVFAGEKLATIYFWRAVGWNKKGNYTQVIADAGEAIRLHPSVAALQSARLGLLRQGRGRHRDIRFQRRAADRAAERHHLSQPRQRLALQGRIRQGDRRLRSIDQARSAVGVFLAEPRHFETRARRSRRRAGRHQRSDPARPGHCRSR